MNKTMIVMVSIVVLIALSIWIVYISPVREEPVSIEEDVFAGENQQPVDKDYGDVVPIGAIAAKTGDASEINKLMFTALSYAAEELNEKGGLLGRSVKIFEFDNMSTALGARKAAQDASLTEVVAVIGTMRSSLTLAAAEELQKAGIPMITPMSTNPDVTKVGDYIFRACFTDDFQGEVLANFAYNDLKAERSVTLTNVNRVFSIALSDIFKETFEDLGGMLVANIDYLDRETDYAPMLNRVAEMDPQVIMIPGDVRDAGLIIKQSREMEIDAVFIGPDSWSKRMYLFAGDYAENGFYSTHWHRDQDSELSRAFVSSYPDKDERDLRALHALTYDSLTILADAIGRAGSLDRTEIRKALSETKNLMTISGSITFDANGDPVGKRAVILRLSNGDYQYYKTVESERDIN